MWCLLQPQDENYGVLPKMLFPYEIDSCGVFMMPDEMFVPSDNEEAKRRGEEWSLKQRGLHFNTPSGYWGVCGPASIAALTRKTVKEVIESWSFEFKGYSPMFEMGEALKKVGFQITRVNGRKLRWFPLPKTNEAILRIQWLKDDGSEYPWWCATQNTHYVLMKNYNGRWWIFCNSHLWFEIDSIIGKEYLKLGYVSSYFELKKR